MADYTDTADTQGATDAAVAEKSEKAGSTAKKKRDQEALLKEARERANECIEREADERKRKLDDLKFSTLDQWPEDIRAEREGDVTNGPRPCLTIDKCNQYIAQVVNDERQNRPAIKVRPVDDAGDVETAKVLQEHCRHVEDHSNAQVAYLNGGESAVRIGEGYFRILTQYESAESFQQEIIVKPCPDYFCVYLGPHVMPDGSDAEYGFVFDDMPEERFKSEFPGKKADATAFADVTINYPQWRTEKTIRVAEYFYFDYEDTQLLFLVDGRTLLKAAYDELPEPRPEIKKKRPTRIKTQKWCKLTGVEVLSEEEFPCDYIPIVKVLGREAIVNGKRTSWGLVRPAKDALRAYNYWISTITEKIGLAPKAPFIGLVGQFETHKDKWDKANVNNYSRLEADLIEVNGQPAPLPQRQAPAAMEAAMFNMLPLLEHDVQTSIGMFKASVGQNEGDQSGRALLALQRESDTGTFHFSDNLNLSIRHAGRIIVNMTPRVKDVKQLLRLVGEDGAVSAAAIDPEQKVAKREIQLLGGKIRKIFNPGVGKYDVTVTSGPSYNTKRMEAAQVFSELAKGATDPGSAAIMRYLTVKHSDFTSSDEALYMLKSQVPPNAFPKEDGPDAPPQVKAQMAQMGQVIQAAGAKIQELESGNAQAQAKLQATHDEKMAALAQDDKYEQEKARLARERFEFEKQLEIDKANHAIDLEERRVAAANKQQTDKLSFERECAEREAQAKEAPEVAPRLAALTEQLTTQVEQIIVQGVKDIEKKVEEAKPVSVKTLKDAAGRIVGGIAKYSNGEERQVTIQ